jgi:hypothetical protein
MSKQIGPGRLLGPPRLKWDSDCGLSGENGGICDSAGGACSLCVWSCAAPPGLPGPVGAFSGTASGSVLSSMAVAGLSLGACMESAK